MAEQLQEYHQLGETLDSHSLRVLRLAHEGLKQAPQFMERHRKFIGTTFVLSATAIIVASSAINNILRAGGHEITDLDVLKGLTEESLLLEEHNMSRKALDKAKAVGRTVGHRITTTIHH